MKRLILAAVLLVAACSGGGGSTPSPTETPEAEITLAPEPTIDIEGLGVITFGKSFDEDTLEVIEPNGKFKRNDPEIAYSAALVRPVGGTSMEVVVASVSKSGSERVILKEEVDVSNPDSDLFANSLDLASIVGNKPGTYVMRYIESGDVLAEGTFTLVK